MAIRSQLESLACFPDESEFSKSLTFNSWVPIACDDIHILIPFKQIYGREPRISGTKEGGPFFFYNHPINYVSVRGYCLSVDVAHLKREKDRIKISMTISDSTGKSVEAVKFSYAQDPYYKSLQRKFVRVNGYLGLNRNTMEREIKIHDICVAASTLKEEFLLAEEVMVLRQRILMKPWRIKSRNEPNRIQQSGSIVDVNCHNIKYCSFHRQDTTLAGRLPKKFIDLSKQEIAVNGKFQVGNAESPVYYLVFANTRHHDQAAKFINSLTNMGYEIHENLLSVTPLQNTTPVIQEYCKFLLSICDEQSLYQVEIDDSLLQFSQLAARYCATDGSNVDVKKFIENCILQLYRTGKMIALKNLVYQKVGRWNLGPEIYRMIKAAKEDFRSRHDLKFTTRQDLSKVKRQGLDSRCVSLGFATVKNAIHLALGPIDNELIMNVATEILLDEPDRWVTDKKSGKWYLIPKKTGD